MIAFGISRKIDDLFNPTSSNYATKQSERRGAKRGKLSSFSIICRYENKVENVVSLTASSSVHTNGIVALNGSALFGFLHTLLLNCSRAPAWGYCASQNMHYYSYKLHALCVISGVIHSYEMTAANVHDLHYLKDAAWEYHDCLILGDKGYLSAHMQQNLFENACISLDVPYKLNQKDWKPPAWLYRRFR